MLGHCPAVFTTNNIAGFSDGLALLCGHLPRSKSSSGQHCHHWQVCAYSCGRSTVSDGSCRPIARFPADLSGSATLITLTLHLLTHAPGELQWTRPPFSQSEPPDPLSSIPKLLHSGPAWQSSPSSPPSPSSTPQQRPMSLLQRVLGQAPRFGFCPSSHSRSCIFRVSNPAASDLVFC